LVTSSRYAASASACAGRAGAACIQSILIGSATASAVAAINMQIVAMLMLGAAVPAPARSS